MNSNLCSVKLCRFMKANPPLGCVVLLEPLTHFIVASVEESLLVIIKDGSP